MSTRSGPGATEGTTTGAAIAQMLNDRRQKLPLALVLLLLAFSSCRRAKSQHRDAAARAGPSASAASSSPISAEDLLNLDARCDRKHQRGFCLVDKGVRGKRTEPLLSLSVSGGYEIPRPGQSGPSERGLELDREGGVWSYTVVPRGAGSQHTLDDTSWQYGTVLPNTLDVIRRWANVVGRAPVQHTSENCIDCGGTLIRAFPPKRGTVMLYGKSIGGTDTRQSDRAKRLVAFIRDLDTQVRERRKQGK